MPETKPWALILFSGKSRPGDIQHALAAKGWRVCAVDTIAPKPTNLLDDAVWQEISMDMAAKAFEVVWIATPCETFSPLREQHRVLRNLEYVKGIPRDRLTLAEQKQLKEFWSKDLRRRYRPRQLLGKPGEWRTPTMARTGRPCGRCQRLTRS